MIFKQLLVIIYIFVFKYFLCVYLAHNSLQGWETGLLKAIYLLKHCITSLDLLLLSHKSAASWGSVNLLPASHFCHHFTNPDKRNTSFVQFGFKVCQMKMLRTFKNPQGFLLSQQYQHVLS